MIADKGRHSSAVKWSPAHAEAIETGNGGRCGVMASNSAIGGLFYFPQSVTQPAAAADKQPYTPSHI